MKWSTPKLETIDPDVWKIIRFALKNDFNTPQLKGLLIALAMHPKRKKPPK